MTRKTNKEYEQELKDKGIRVKPKENYKGWNTKILHKCTCGNTWHVTPSHVKAGRKCGCLAKEHRERLKNQEKRKCSIKGCNKKHKANGYCDRHYYRVRANGAPDIVQRDRENMRLCTVEGCNEKHHGLGYCQKHLTRFKRKGYVELDNKFYGFAHKGCLIKGCNKAHKSTGYCDNHYRSFRIYGNPLFAEQNDTKSLMEKEISEFLDKESFIFEQQQIFDDLRGKRKRNLRYDFSILENEKIIALIEFHGIQHFEYISFFHRKGLKDFIKQQERDQIKRDYAAEKGIPLIEITYKHTDPIKQLEKELKALGIGTTKKRKYKQMSLF